MKLKSKNFWSIVMIIVIVAIDQVTKYFAKLYLYGKGSVTLISGVVDLVYAENTGAAFSFFTGGRWFIAAFSVICLAVILYIMFSGKRKVNLWIFWSLAVIASGAIGNLIDRVRLGYVIDFINPTFVNFAVFNIADCAVTLGTVSLVLYFVYDIIKEKKADEQAD